jgi:hypothetical protein
MIEWKRQVGRREALRIVMLGALALLTGCGEEKTGRLWGAIHRKDKHRQKMLIQLKNGNPLLPRANVIKGRTRK